MSPNVTELENSQSADPLLANPNSEHRSQIIWFRVGILVYVHCTALYGLYRLLTFNVNLGTVLFSTILGSVVFVGLTAGVHRLWAHRSFKARLPLRLLLALFQTVAFQNHIYCWARDHRMHHKFTDTDADPHNSRRGFFFSHMGWLMVRKHKDVLVKGKTVDMSDLDKDWVVVWQRRLFPVLGFICCFAFPTWVPVQFWGETFWDAWNTNMARYVVSLHITCMGNSVVHMWGKRPYNKNISAADSTLLAIFTWGEGWHNAHHVFPWDYKSANLGSRIDMTTYFIEKCALLGQAYDLKTVSEELIRKQIQRCGDGSIKLN